MDEFRDEWEKMYGKMTAPIYHSKEDELESTIRIASTGQGARYLLGFMMTDRAKLTDQRRRWEKEEIGFTPVDHTTLPYGCKNCPICQDDMGIESPEGEKEEAIRLVYCCGNIFGKECLLRWVDSEQGGRQDCPFCRAVFTHSLINKLVSDYDGMRPGEEEFLDDELESESEDEDEDENGKDDSGVTIDEYGTLHYGLTSFGGQ